MQWDRARSHWLTLSIGTLISSSDEVVKLKMDAIAIDWHISIVKVNFVHLTLDIVIYLFR